MRWEREHCQIHAKKYDFKFETENFALSCVCIKDKPAPKSCLFCVSVFKIACHGSFLILCDAKSSHCTNTSWGSSEIAMQGLTSKSIRFHSIHRKKLPKGVGKKCREVLPPCSYFKNKFKMNNSIYYWNSKMGSRILLTYLDYVYKLNVCAKMVRFKMQTLLFLSHGFREKFSGSKSH